MRYGTWPLVCLTVVLSLTGACSHSSAPDVPVAPESTSRFLVQAESMDAAAEAVTAVGGLITHELRIISAVGAELTPSQLEALGRIEGITISADRGVSTTGKRETAGGARR